MRFPTVPGNAFRTTLLLLRRPADGTQWLDISHQNWTVEVTIDEQRQRTRARARLRWRGKHLTGLGIAHLNPSDRNIAEIGAELAVAEPRGDSHLRKQPKPAPAVSTSSHEKLGWTM